MVVFRYLKCMVPLCKAVAMTTVSTFRQIKIPVLSPSHNHPPDFEYKNRLVMINRMRDMAISTSHPIDSIFSQTYKQYEQELGGNTERYEHWISPFQLKGETTVFILCYTSSGYTRALLQDNMVFYIINNENTLWEAAIIFWKLLISWLANKIFSRGGWGRGAVNCFPFLCQISKFKVK